MHVRQLNQTIVKDVDAFAGIWKELGILRVLAFLIKHQSSCLFFMAGYRLFSMTRPFLFKKKCKNSKYPKEQVEKSLSNSSHFQGRESEESL